MTKIYNAAVIIVCVFVTGCEISENAVPRFNAMLQGSYLEPEDPLKPMPSDNISKYKGAEQRKMAIEDSRIWAQKNKQLTMANQNLKNQNQELAEDNKRLRERYTAMKDALDKTEKELNDANDLLIEMRKELDGWKTDVLGHREQLDAQNKAQMEALIKILKLMGAEYVE